MIRELRTFLAIAREGTFAAAGDRVGLTQAAVSAQMQRLEAELGFELFDRSARAARLNARAHQVVQQAQELMRLYAALGSPQEEPVPATRVNLGAIASVQRSVLPGVLAKFHRRVPHCSTRIVPGLSSQLADLVDAGELDLAIAIRPPHALPADLRWTTLVQEPFRLLVPRAVKGRDWAKLLAGQPFIRYDRGSFGGRQVDRFLRAANLAVREVCEVDELEAIVGLVAQGVGVALLPQAAGPGRWPAGVRAIDLGEHTFHREIGLLRRARVAPGVPADTLAGLVLSAYRRPR